jgi:serine/threonine-protein kinase
VITPDEGVTIGGRYTLRRPLARGSMGSVWVARHRELEIDVGVKFMAPSLVASPEARARFEHEAKAAARLDSQHVVHVLDYGVEDATPYIVMDLLRGETLATRLARQGTLPFPVAVRLVVQVCKALRTAHEAGLVHRDLKPGNLFLALKDEDEVVKVLDFGIAKARVVPTATSDEDGDESVTASGTILGSASYMSPEQVRDASRVDQRSDLWSLAVILYRVLVGRLPFPGKDFAQVLVSVCRDPVPPPSSVAEGLPPRLDGFFARAFERAPERRFQTARDFAEAFCSIPAEDDPGSPASVPVGKRTILMHTASVPPPPPSSGSAPSDPTARISGATSSGTQIMIVGAGASWPPRPPGEDDDATLMRPPSSIPDRPNAEAEPTLNTADYARANRAAPPMPEDPPELPVHRVWPAWAAIALLVAGGVGYLAVRAVGGTSAAGPASTSETASAPTTPAPPATAAPTAATAATAATTATSGATSPSAASTPPPAASAPRPLAAGPDAGAPAAPSVHASQPPAPRPPPSAPVRSQVVDGIVRDPFAH